MKDRAISFVELCSPEQGFDQKCIFGNRVESHAVYCHSEHPDAPRKCRRSWYSGKTVLDEDCPFYVENPKYIE
jgi:hypothetical protein